MEEEREGRTRNGELELATTPPFPSLPFRRLRAPSSSDERDSTHSISLSLSDLSPTLDRQSGSLLHVDHDVDTSILREQTLSRFEPDVDGFEDSKRSQSSMDLLSK